MPPMRRSWYSFAAELAIFLIASWLTCPVIQAVAMEMSSASWCAALWCTHAAEAGEQLQRALTLHLIKTTRKSIKKSQMR